MLSDGFWRRRFGADPSVIGRVVRLDDVEGGRESSGGIGYEIVGVMPPEFAYPVGGRGPRTSGCRTSSRPTSASATRSRSRGYLQVIARLSPGVSLDQARAQMDVLALAIERANPTWNKNRAIGVLPLVDHIVGAHMRSWMLMLLGAVGIVLLIACANVANLLLRPPPRAQREVAIRATSGRPRPPRAPAAGRKPRPLDGRHGAGRGRRLVGHPDSAVGHCRRRAAGRGYRDQPSSAWSGRVAVAGHGHAVRYRASPPELQGRLTTALKSGGPGSTGAGSRRLRHLFVVVEFALAVVLVVGASLFIGSFVSVLRIDPGFDPGNVLTTQISPPVVDRTRPRDVAPVIAQIVEQIARVPGVLSAAATGGNVPLGGGLSMTVDDQAGDGSERGWHGDRTRRSRPTTTRRCGSRFVAGAFSAPLTGRMDSRSRFSARPPQRNTSLA